jgi:glycosyltransferase involved in cell wall biosynthesis
MKIGIAAPIATDNIASFLSGDIGGLPRGYYGAPLLGTLIGALLDRGHEVIAFTTSTDINPSAKPVVAAGERFKIHYCPVRRRAFRRENGHWGRAMDAFRLERAALTQAMLDTQPDIIHAHWTYEFALAALDSGLPHLITCHDAPQVVLRYMPDIYRLVRYFMARRVLAHARRLTAVSPYLVDKVAQYAQVPISVVPNPIPSTLTNIATVIHHFDPTRPRIAMVLNGWGKRKNPQPALRAFARLRQKMPSAELVVMGKDFGPREQAERWAQTQGMADGIHFLGALPYPLLLAELAKVDLLLHPSLEETFGMSVAEAMALGVPVIGGEKSGAVPWVIGEGGMTVDVTSVNAITDAMCQLLSNNMEHARYCKDAKQQTIARFSATHIAQAYEAEYQAAIKGARN